MSKIIEAIEKRQLRPELTSVEVGHLVKVHYRIVEGEKERVQIFEGVVIGKHCGEKNIKSTFTVRKVSQGFGIERVFPLHSPRIEKLEIIRVGKVRRAKLYYLRDRFGKAARIKEKLRARS